MNFEVHLNKKKYMLDLTLNCYELYTSHHQCDQNFLATFLGWFHVINIACETRQSSSYRCTLCTAKTQLSRIVFKNPWEASWRSYAMTHEITEHLFLGWLLVDLGWSWQNPAHDQFPCTYQLFYRSKGKLSFSV